MQIKWSKYQSGWQIRQICGYQVCFFSSPKYSKTRFRPGPRYGSLRRSPFVSSPDPESAGEGDTLPIPFPSTPSAPREARLSGPSAQIRLWCLRRIKLQYWAQCEYVFRAATSYATAVDVCVELRLSACVYARQSLIQSITIAVNFGKHPAQCSIYAMIVQFTCKYIALTRWNSTRPIVRKLYRYTEWPLTR